MQRREVPLNTILIDPEGNTHGVVTRRLEKLAKLGDAIKQTLQASQEAARAALERRIVYDDGYGPAAVCGNRWVTADALSICERPKGHEGAHQCGHQRWVNAAASAEKAA